MSARKRASSTSSTSKNNKTTKRHKGPTPKGDEQKHALKSIMQNDITILYGPAGTGKTYLSVLYGLVELSKGRFDKIILARPCVEAYGEHLGHIIGISTGLQGTAQDNHVNRDAPLAVDKGILADYNQPALFLRLLGDVGNLTGMPPHEVDPLLLKPLIELFIAGTGATHVNV